MTSESFEQLLERAAGVCGIDPGFWDIWGKYHDTSAEAKRAIVSAMGLACGSVAELQRALADRERREWERLAPACVVTGEVEAPELSLNVPADCLGERAHIRVRREDGQTSEADINLWELPQTGSAEMDGRTWVQKRATLPIALPLGYHDIGVELGSMRAQTRYIVTPERAWTDPHLGRGGRAAGFCISLYGVRSGRNLGCGDFRDLLAIVDWAAARLDVSFVGLNPLHAIHNRRPFNTSPYLPNCIYYQNYIYLDVEGIEDFERSARAQRCRRSAEVEEEIARLREAPFVEYERVAALKLRLLKLAFLEFLRERRRGSARSCEFDAYLAREGQLLERFALYCALDEWLHRRNPDLWIWPDWPREYQDPESAETRDFARKHWRSVLFYQYLQWQIDTQLAHAQRHSRDRGLALGLYHDLALATDRFGSDLWAHRPFFVSGCRVGSPPDDFAPGGQDWGFPPPNAERHRENGYQLFAESIRKNCRHGGALRIDHVMRLFRLYWIPDENDARAGAYVQERSLNFLRILALESVRNRVVVVGEDLGTVDPAIRETLSQFGILSYRLFYFEKREDGGFKPFDQYPGQALVSSTTHDLPTVAGFWSGTDISARREAGVLDEAAFHRQMASRQMEKQKMLDELWSLGLLAAHLPRDAAAYPELTGELHNAIAGFLASTPSHLLAINQEDLTKETAQQNLPGTTWQYPNWGRKMRFTIDELEKNPEAAGFTAMFRNWIERTGRKNRTGHE